MALFFENEKKHSKLCRFLGYYWIFISPKYDLKRMLKNVFSQKFLTSGKMSEISARNFSSSESQKKTNFIIFDSKFLKMQKFPTKNVFIKRLLMHRYKPPYNGFIWCWMLVNIREFWKKQFSKKTFFFQFREEFIYHAAVIVEYVFVYKNWEFLTLKFKWAYLSEFLSPRELRNVC